MLSAFLKVLLVILPLLSGTQAIAQNTSDTQTFSRWLQEMKVSIKGPFSQIRWFCNDGTILPPEPFACKSHGGGRQHGEWNEHIQVLRSTGFYVANVLAQIDATDLVKTDNDHAILKQILLERFLIEIDDGWIFRGARHYRGALQVEDENQSGRQLLLALLAGPKKVKQEFMIMREAARFLPHGQPSLSVTEVRQLSTTLSELDTQFMFLRNKIHSQPDQLDAQRVRDYISSHNKNNPAKYERLAVAIDDLYKKVNVTDHLIALSKSVQSPDFTRKLQQYTTQLADHADHASHRFRLSSQLLMLLRDQLATIRDTSHQLAVLDVSLMLELTAFTTGNRLLRQLPSYSRRARLNWLADTSKALYGTGLISKRQWNAIQDSLAKLNKPNLTLSVYREELRFLSRVPSWTNRWMQFHFGNSIDHLGRIEPKIHRFVPEKLREGPLLVYTRVLDSLMKDANRQAGLRHQLFGKTIGTGLRALNPGLVRGILRFPAKKIDTTKFKPDGIYLLPATIAKLSPVAGILTLEEGNALSHLQILANNLGIPNVVVDNTLLPQFKVRANKRVVLAVSPAGSVQLDEDGQHWDEIFNREAAIPVARISPNLKKLNLGSRDFVSLDRLRATDAGRIVGPKAANLGELKYHFPGAVADGLAIPFGVFRQLLEQNMEGLHQSVYSWMQDQYRIIKALTNKPKIQQRARQAFFSKLKNWITTADPGSDFRRRLKNAMHQVFGKDGSYAVFVRSDTNLEDLPGFTGAGLNLTVPNVVGFNNVLEAIARVWASPFTDRAYAWRQQRMDQPEHVYSSILLMRTVPVEKSGVMVTMDVETGRHSGYSVAVNEGVGGAVAGQAAEELRINAYTGKIRLLAEATSYYRRVVTAQSGLKKLPASSNDAVLTSDEIAQLRRLGKELPKRIHLLNDQDQLAPLDVEFGFHQNKLMLFQVRPYLQSQRAKQSRYLNLLDINLTSTSQQIINLDATPGKMNQAK